MGTDVVLINFFCYLVPLEKNKLLVTQKKSD